MNVPTLDYNITHLEVFVVTQVFIGMKTFTVFCKAFRSLNICLVNCNIKLFTVPSTSQQAKSLQEANKRVREANKRLKEAESRIERLMRLLDVQEQRIRRLEEPDLKKAVRQRNSFMELGK